MEITTSVATPETDAKLKKEYMDLGVDACKKGWPRVAPCQDQTCMLAEWFFEGYDQTTQLYTLNNAFSGFQGNYKRVVCVCTAGKLRSATAAAILSQEPFNFNTRTVGTDPEYAMCLLNQKLISWADEILFMEDHHVTLAKKKLNLRLDYTPYHVLNIPDIYEYRHPELIALIKDRYCTAIGFQI